MIVDSYGSTHLGNIRSNNEDSFLMDESLRLFCVADGIGSLACGEVASRSAVHLLKNAAIGADTLKMPLNFREVMLSVNESIMEIGEVVSPLEGIGTTLIAFQLFDNNANFVHSGDSRAYYFSGPTSKQISTDQTIATQKKENGIPESEITSIDHHTLRSCMGLEPMFDPIYFSHSVEAKSCIILCSDGASNYVSQEEMHQIYQLGDPSQKIIEKIISLSLERGGSDNITAVCVKF